MNPDGNLNYFSDGFQIFWMYIVPETISWPGLETISWPPRGPIQGKKKPAQLRGLGLFAGGRVRRRDAWQRRPVPAQFA